MDPRMAEMLRQMAAQQGGGGRGGGGAAVPKEMTVADLVDRTRSRLATYATNALYYGALPLLVYAAMRTANLSVRDMTATITRIPLA